MTSKPCERTEHVAEYAMRALPVDETSAFEAHVRGCTDCQRELEALRPIIDSFVDWPTNVLRPAPLWSRLAERVGIDPGEAEGRWADEPPWKDVAPGIRCKLLSTDAATGMVSMLVNLAPRTSYPPHTHAGVEELHLLEGELFVEDRKLLPGDYNRAEPGTGDQIVYSETGCTCVLITSRNDILR